MAAISGVARKGSGLFSKIREDLIGHIAGDGERARPLAAARGVYKAVAGSCFDEFEPGLAEQFLHRGFGAVFDYRPFPCRPDRSDFAHPCPLLPEGRRKAAMKTPWYYDYCGATVT